LKRLYLFLLLFFTPLSLKGLDQKAYEALLRKPTPTWMVERIQKDLAPFEWELSQKNLDEIHSRLCCIRIKVKERHLTISGPKAGKNPVTEKEYSNYVHKLHEAYPLPDVDFLICLHDTIENPMEHLPVGILSKNQQAHCLLIPDWFALNGYGKDKKRVEEGNKKYPWEKKKEILFFRGSDTGCGNSRPWLEYPRPKLVSLSLQRPDLIDARFVNFLHKKELEGWAFANGYMSGFVKMDKNPKYKYLMNIDGNCAAAPRLPLLMHSNSVIFKQESPSIQWFYDKLKPYVHYIPVRDNLSDIFQKILWAQAHDEECREISERAQKFARQYLTEEMVYLYFYRLIEAYARKQRIYL
jgi:hypothetical protein